jgi:sec-independent protein translocase protein TatC
MAVKLKHDDDLFKESTMTFGEHLEELRRALFLALIGLFAGTLLGLTVGKHVVMAIQAPLTNALVTYYKDASKLRAQERVQEQVAKGVQIPHAAADYESLIDQGMIFDSVYLESDELVNALRKSNPAALGTTAPTSNPKGHPLSKLGPTSVTPEELGDGRGMAQALIDAGKSDEDGPAKRVWGMLSADDRAVVESVVKADGLSEEEQKALMTRFAGVLTALLANPTFADDPAFGELQQTDEALTLAKLTPRGDEESRRRNRLMLEAIFADQLSATHPDLVPILIWRRVEESPDTRIKSLSAAEVFGFYIKASLLVGAVLSSPWVFYQLWSFVAAGLYPHEKKYVYLYLPFSIGLFLIGATAVFLFVFEPVLNYLFVFNRWLKIDPDPRISEWLGMALFLPIGFGLSFQLPLVMLFLQRIGVITVEMYLAKWRIAVLVIFVIAMLLTPAEPISMMMMAAPLTFLYFGGVALCKWMPRGRSPFDD